MNYVAIATLAFFVGSLSLPVPGTYLQAYKPPIEAKAGDVATGTVVRQDGQVLILNTTPCNSDQGKQIVIFRSPFSTKNAEQIACPDGKKVQQITANQE